MAAWAWPPLSVADSLAPADLAKFSEAAYVTATTGPANLVACVICRDEHSLYEFLTTKVGALPHVERVETAPVIRTLKQAFPHHDAPPLADLGGADGLCAGKKPPPDVSDAPGRPLNGRAIITDRGADQ
jgi:hypothetical protein